MKLTLTRAWVRAVRRSKTMALSIFELTTLEKRLMCASHMHRRTSSAQTRSGAVVTKIRRWTLASALCQLRMAERV